MKNRFIYPYMLFLGIALACSEDKIKEDQINVNHVGEAWKISSVDYNIVDQSTSGQGVKIGTKADAGTFYFDGTSGSFDITIDKVHKEDVFNFTENANDITIVSISQNVGTATLSQNVIAISGDKTSATAMTLQGTITKQSLSGQFVMTATFSLVKQ
jgi:hypothetical protein